MLPDDHSPRLHHTGVLVGDWARLAADIAAKGLPIVTSGDLGEIKYAYVGDTRSNMGHSLLIVGCLLGMDVRICGPKSLWPSEEYMKIAKDLRAGGAVIKTAYNAKLKKTIVVDGRDRTIYLLISDSGGIPSCAALSPACPKAWPAVAAQGKPVAITEFGTCAYRGAEKAAGMGWNVVDHDKNPEQIKGPLVHSEHI